MGLHVITSGNGPVIVMLHGFLSSSTYFKRFRKEFEHSHTVITVDLLGSGKSSRPGEPVTYESHIEALHTILCDLPRPFVLLGHSMGALIAARYAILFPEHIRSVILFNPPVFSSTDQAKRSIEATGFHYRAALSHPRSHLLWRALKLLPRMPQQFTAPLNLTSSLQTHRYAREGGYSNIILRAELIHDLVRIPQPTLLIAGKRDRSLYRETLSALSIPRHVSVQEVATGHHTLVHKPHFARQLVMSHLLQ